MKICVIGTRGFPDFIGGIETVCKNLYSELVKLDTSIEVLVLTRHTQNIVNNINLTQQITVKTMPTINIPGVENVLSTFLSLMYTMVFVRPEIIHLHGIGPGFFTRIAKLTGSKVVVTTHGVDYERPKWGKFARWFLKSGEAIATKHADKMICVSQALQDDLQARFVKHAGNVMTIRNGGSLPKPENKGAESPTLLIPKSYFLYVGRLEAGKAIDLLMKAYKQSGSDKKLLIVGSAIDGNAYWNYLQTLASPNISFVGAKYGAELIDLYKNATALVHPSMMEGYCLVVAEAISVGIPVLLSDVPAHREFMLPEDSFFKVGDVNQLAGKLAAASMDKYITQEAIDYQHANTWTINAQKHLTLYRQLSI